ncbi:MAG TPA: hypothetical protein VHL53_17615 [Acidimicrobiia bacterium]|nr:hypothetical protein [Acidimicrobiia bacterium]
MGAVTVGDLVPGRGAVLTVGKAAGAPPGAVCDGPVPAAVVEVTAAAPSGTVPAAAAAPIGGVVVGAAEPPLLI